MSRRGVLVPKNVRVLVCSMYGMLPIEITSNGHGACIAKSLKATCSLTSKIKQEKGFPNLILV